MAMPRLFALAFAVLAGHAAAAPFAFVSLSDPSLRAVRVVDLETMAIETTIGNVGDEPSRMVANADRTLIYLSSWADVPGLFNEGQVYVIDTRLRRVIASRAVGIKQNRSIALSPDGLRVYTWKLESVDGVTTIGVAVLDAITLAEIAVAPISGPSCIQFASQIAVAPDGRIVAAGCDDGLRIIDPVTFAVSIGGLAARSSSPVYGFSPDGGEVYVAAAGTGAVSAGGTGVRAIDLTTGIGTDFFWQVPGGSPVFPNGSGAVRMVVVQRPDDLPGDPTVFFSYDSSFGNTPLAWARASDLAPPAGPRVRRMIGRAALGPASAVGASPDGSIGLGARLGGIRRLLFETPGAEVVAADGAILPFLGVGTLTDVIVSPYLPDPLFQDNFEQ
jgi:hypothetical protein